MVRKIQAKLVLKLRAEALSGRAISASQQMSRESITAGACTAEWQMDALVYEDGETILDIFEADGKTQIGTKLVGKVYANEDAEKAMP